MDNIQNIKIDLIQWITTLENASVINKIMDIRNTEDNDWWDSISKEEQQSISNGIKDADRGKLESHSSVKKIYDKWL